MATNPVHPTTPARWFCLRAQARREHTAAANLERRVGVEVFAPRLRMRRARGGLVATLAEALFPGYVFARFEYPAQLRHVVSTAGVAGVVAFGGEPPPVADGVIDFLRAQIGQAAPGAATPWVAEGEWVRIVAGCFRQAEGRVLRVDPRTERVCLLLSLLGRTVQVSVFAHQLESLNPLAPGVPPGLRAIKTGGALLAG